MNHIIPGQNPDRTQILMNEQGIWVAPISVSQSVPDEWRESRCLL